MENQKLSENTTLVKVLITEVKYFDEENNSVETVRLTGRYSIPECRDYVKTLFQDNIYISKENLSEQFPVSTVELYQLKGIL